MEELNSFDVYNLVKEAQFLVGGKIDNIYQTDKKDLFLQAYVKDKPKQLLRIVAGKYFYLVSARPEFSNNMMKFCAYLRKYLINSRIKSFEQVDAERIIKISLETKDSVYELYTELFGKGIIVITKDGKIISLSEEQEWTDRILKIGEQYKFPQRADSREMFEKFRKKGSEITMQKLDKEVSSAESTAAAKTSPKAKEIRKIQNIIDKQTESVAKMQRASDENRKKGEYIYENFQELQEMAELADKKDIQSLKKHRIFKELKGNSLILETK